MMKISGEIIKYAKNYRSRHANNINLILHIVGVPEVFAGLFQLVTGNWRWGLFNIFVGYLLQWIGHTCIEKNEIGELIGLKRVAAKMFGKKRA